MNIAGLHKTSLLDYPEKVSTVIFTSGCNLSCPFCHNPELVSPQLGAFKIPETEIWDFLKKRKKILDAVVITGGEPTIYPDLIDFIGKIKKMGYLVKLDTNGTNPEMIKKILDTHLLDYIAMDIKGALSDYPRIVGKEINLDNIKKSIDYITKSKIDYEFRTTVVPTLHDKNTFRDIGLLIKNANKYYIQQFRNSKTLSDEFKEITPYSDEKIREFEKIMQKYVKHVGVRGL